MFCNINSQFYSFVLIVSAFIIYAKSDVPRPRGVSLAKASLYSPGKDFTCFDGTITIPFSYVNDDYCDCFDGSDEPGTPACLNGIFHCTNAGHRAQNIPSSRVNDGICDCCDGTDEYDSMSIQCQNTCEELGREARAEAQRMAELLKAGSQLRQELVSKGDERRNEMAKQLTQLKKDKEEAEKIRMEKEALKTELETKENEMLQFYREAEELERARKAQEENDANKKEAEETFTRYDSDSDGYVTVEELKVRISFDRNKDGEVSEEEAKYFLSENERVDLETFVSTAWPIIKPILMMEEGLFHQPAADDEEQLDDDDDEKEISETQDDVNEGEEDAEDLDTDLHREEVESDHHQIYDEETQNMVNAATEARKQLTDAERTMREIEANIRNIEQNLEKDYGPHQEFATLEGECYEYEDKEYIYKLCLFQRIVQKPKSGGSEIGLGNWGEWVGDNNIYEVMKYSNGVACWNGPNRSTTVHLQCGLETKIISVTEPFRCEYKMEMISPAACDETRVPHSTPHDEL